jgi:hypothetical protein
LRSDAMDRAHVYREHSSKTHRNEKRTKFDVFVRPFRYCYFLCVKSAVMNNSIPQWGKKNVELSHKEEPKKQMNK